MVDHVRPSTEPDHLSAATGRASGRRGRAAALSDRRPSSTGTDGRGRASTATWLRRADPGAGHPGAHGGGRVIAVLTQRVGPTPTGRQPGELERPTRRVRPARRDDRRRRLPLRRRRRPAAATRPRGRRRRDGARRRRARARTPRPTPCRRCHRVGHRRAHASGCALDRVGLDDERCRTRSSPEHGRVRRGRHDRRHVVLGPRASRCSPAGSVTGALLLVRDVTDLRRRDRLLLSKDATIREIHHRVKNNLQTISSLLRLQGRRLSSRRRPRRDRGVGAAHPLDRARARDPVA